MLEIRYAEATGVITAWAGSPKFKGGHLEAKVGEQIIVVHRPKLLSSPGDYLVVDGHLKRVKEPEQPRDLAGQIDELRAEIDTLKGG